MVPDDYDVTTDPQMLALFDQARLKRLWFYTNYQQIWFTPEELRTYQMEGRFRWGPPNWRLRDPQEYLDEVNREVECAMLRQKQIVAKIAKWRS
jgi:hypothetical protein